MEIIKYDPKVEREILDLVKDIPFENSFVQTRSVIDSAITPEKAFKVIGLRLMKRLQDLKVCGIKREQVLNEVDLLKYEYDNLKFDDPKLVTLHQKRLDLVIREKIAGFDYEDKLAEDCKSELGYLYGLITKMPKYTREQFEHGEERWLNIKLKELGMGIAEPKTPKLAEMLEKGQLPSDTQIDMIHQISFKQIEK